MHEAAEAAGITPAFRAPELMPLEALWRGLKATAAANRCYPAPEDLTHNAIDWLDAMTQAERHRRSGFQSSTFDWVPP